MHKIKRIKAVFFSPTGNTKQIVEQLANRFAQQLGISIGDDDFTLPENQSGIRSYAADDFIVFGVPTYAGRIPNKVLPFVQNLFKGNNTFAVAVVTFGNRSFDNSLSELAGELNRNGFAVLGAASIVCRHAFAHIGTGRPNSTDKQQLAVFGDAIVQKLQTAALPLPDIVIKRNEALTAYYQPLGLDGKPVNFLKAKPVTDKAKCNNCGVCATRCPMSAIDKSDTAVVPGTCIKCQACITYCTKKAKTFTDSLFLSHKAMLEQNYNTPAVSEFFV